QRQRSDPGLEHALAQFQTQTLTHVHPRFRPRRRFITLQRQSDHFVPLKTRRNFFRLTDCPKPNSKPTSFLFYFSSAYFMTAPMEALGPSILRVALDDARHRDGLRNRP